MEEIKDTKKCKLSSRVLVAYFVILVWVGFGLFGALYQPKDAAGHALDRVKFTSMAVYFISLTGFVGSFLYGSTIKPKEDTTPIFVKGNTDKREIIVYISIFLWLILGIGTILKNFSLEEAASYFAALTPFVAGYILGETARHSGDAVDSITNTINNATNTVASALDAEIKKP